MKRVLLLFGMIILVAALIGACGGGDNPTESTNTAPDQPALDGPSGAPTNGQTGVSLTPTLRWTCTDPDGDELTYTVMFGTSTPPTAVSTDQSGSSYSPSLLEYSTRYYWSVTAKDPSGESTGSAVWNFTTLAAPVESVSAPTTISGPTTGFIAQSLNFDASGSASNLGHALEYRFEDGLGNYSSWSTTAATLQWGTVGTYDIVAQARCIEHPTVISTWSDPMTVTITAFAVETVTTPGAISGSGSGEEGESINFAVAASTSSLGHTVYYRWDFGDGDTTTWSSTRSRSHTWSTAGTYMIKAQARCNDHQTILSEWSAAKTVTITEAAAEIVTPPTAPTAPDSGTINIALAITNEGGAVSSDGHSLEYRFDYGDGEISAWWYNWTSVSHTYTALGTYNVAMQARCRTHTDIESEWSETTSIVIVDPPEVIPSPPGTINGVTEGGVDESYEYTVYHSSTTNLGHLVEGRYDWGDGTFSDWAVPPGNVASHAWTAEGTYNVVYEARCVIHNEISALSNTLVVTIAATATETVATPGYINWQDAQDRPMLDVETIYYAYGGLSSLGHDTESRISWGDGDTTGWVAMNTQILKTWTELGTFSLTRQSRCVEHPDIISDWSETSYIITGPESVSTPDAPPGPATATKGSAVYFLGTGAESSWHSYSWLSYRFAWGDGDTTVWRDRLDTLVGHNYSTVGEYEVTAQAKCVWPGHTNPVSEWSLPSVINILESITFNESVSGPVDGPINKSLTFVQNFEATSSEGHGMEYRFAFGDGDTSFWAVELTASHAYTTAGTFFVKCQARCAVHTNAMTEWPTTSLHRIDITDDPESVSIPSLKVSLLTTIGDSTWIKLTNASSNYGDSLEYQVDYGDGTFSEWFPSTYNSYYQRWEMEPEYAHHSYAAVGSYEVRGQVRCAVHPTVTSGWSTPTLWTTVEVLESVSMPAAPTGPTTGVIGENMTFTTTGSTSSEGHQLEYIWSYRGPENQFTDYTTSLTDTKVFSMAGEYYVYLLARCVEHPDAQNGWSERFYFTITQ